MPDGTSTQSHRLIRLNTVLGETALIPLRFNSSETVSQGFSFTVTAFSETHHDLTAKDLVGTQVTIGLVQVDNSIRYFNGYVQELTAMGSERAGQKSNYKLYIVSWAQLLLTKRSDIRIFQDKNVESILKDVFSKYARIAKFEFKLESTYVLRRFCVQYNETDWNFFNRMCQLEGLAYYFKHENGAHTLQIVDTEKGFEKLSPETVTIQSQTSTGDHLTHWQNTGKFITGKYSQRTYNYNTPRDLLPIDQVVKTDVTHTTDVESYVYSETYHDKDEAKTDVSRRLKQGAQRASISTATGNCRHLVVGAHFDLALANGGKFSDLGKKFTFSKVSLSADDTSGILNCSIEAIPKGELIYPRGEFPKVSGLQTAVVTGPKGEEVHSDDQGRIKVQFHWDRLGDGDDKSTCWLRVMQNFAGPDFGIHFTPRVGQEVVVAFENGNPDRPFVIGGLYHQENHPPYAKQKGTRSGIRTRSTKGGGITNCNELYFEDVKGKEELYIQAEKDLNGVIKNNESRNIGNNQSVTVGKDQSIKIKNNQTTDVEKNSSHLIGDELLLEAGKKITLKVGGSVIELTGSKIIVKSGIVDIDGGVVQIN